VLRHSYLTFLTFLTYSTSPSQLYRNVSLKMAPQLQKPLLEPGALILVTAANGFIASHIVDQLLNFGYRVRGTVRSQARSSWMTPFFTARHPNASLEIVELPDIGVRGCYDAALVGVSAVIHSAANTSLGAEEGQDVVQEAVDANINILEAVKAANQRGEAIKRVVITTSSWAVMYPRPNTEKQLTAETYDEFAKSMLENPSLPNEFKALMTYVESKKYSEQESWKWYVTLGLKVCRD
jgi:nucleoside-diphosphate-sugar epimerase